VAAAVPAIARSIVATEGRASSTARSLGLLSCAPSPAVG
jgi:hypothetical protein